MKIKETEDGYYLEAESDKENNVIAVITNIIDYSTFPKELQSLEGCIEIKGKFRNYITIPNVEWLNLEGDE